jgi:MFS family permease
VTPPGTPLSPPPRRAFADRLGPFRHRAFAIYWTGGFVSNIGTWLQTVAASVYVYERTGSTIAVGVLNFASFLPIFLFSILGGLIGDRFDRRTVVIVTHAVSGVLATVLAVISFISAPSELEVIVIAFLLNTSYAMAKPALVSILPTIVPRDEITESVGINTLQFVIAQMAGPVLATVIISTAGVSWAFAINALTYLAPILAMIQLRRMGIAAGARAAAAGVRSGAERARVGGLEYVQTHPWVLFLLLGVIASSAPLEIVRTLSPAIAEDLGQHESAAGLLIAAQSAGSAIALLAFVPLRRSGRSRDLAQIGLLLEAAGLALTIVANSLPLAALGGALLGFGFSLCFPVLTSSLQAEVPDAVRGRIMSYHQMSHLGNRPFGAILAGTTAAVVGAQPAVIVGVALIPIGLFASGRAWRALARDHAEADAQPPDDDEDLIAGSDRPAAGGAGRSAREPDLDAAALAGAADPFLIAPEPLAPERVRDATGGPRP